MTAMANESFCSMTRRPAAGRGRRGIVEDGRNNQRHGRERERDDGRARRRTIEALLFVSRSAGQNGEAQDQQNVADDRTGDGGLHHAGEAFRQGDAGDDQLGRVAEGGVEQSAEPSPARAARASVARPIQPAAGIIAMAAQMKSAVGLRRRARNAAQLRSG